MLFLVLKPGLLFENIFQTKIVDLGDYLNGGKFGLNYGFGQFDEIKIGFFCLFLQKCQ